MSSLKFTTILINNFFNGWRTDGYVRLLKAALHRGAIRGMVGWIGLNDRTCVWKGAFGQNCN